MTATSSGGTLLPMAAALTDAGVVPIVPSLEDARAAKMERRRRGGGANVHSAEPDGPAPTGDGESGGDARRGGGGGGIRARWLRLPADLPVEPLGRNGNTFYYLDALRQFQALGADKHGRAMIMQLFGDHAAVLLEHFGKTTKDGTPARGFHADTVADALMVACSKLGIIDPAKAVKGCGAWADDKGGLVLHLGDTVWLDGAYQQPGRYGDAIFPAMPPTMRPAFEAETTDAGNELLRLIRAWHWAHELQPMLVLGWIAQGFVVGALRWRSHMICDGERGTGKSSLNEMVQGIFGNWMLQASDTTPAAVYQLMASRAQPVFFDEFEAGKDPKRKAAVVAVLRQASSGGVVLRGGDDHVGRAFSVQFPAFLTSIVPVALQAQDESRMVRVQLMPLKDHPDYSGKAPDVSPAPMAKLGKRVFRRMVDQWPRWRSTFARYREALDAAGGFDARMQDTYGTLLACADLLLYDSADHGEIGEFAAELGRMVAPRTQENDRDQDRCLLHLLQSTVDRGVGPRRTVASWLRQAAAMDADGGPDRDRRREAVAALGVVGLKPVVQVSHADPALLPLPERALIVQNKHPALKKMFDDSPWPGETGADGAWVTVLRRCEGAGPLKTSVKIGGMNQRGTLVPLRDVIDWGDE